MTNPGKDTKELESKPTQARKPFAESDQAIAALKQRVEQEPDNAAAHRNLAYLLIESDQSPTALRHFNRAIALDPTNEQTTNDAEFLQQLLHPLGPDAQTRDWPSNPMGKIRIRHRGDWPMHRSGWTIGIDALRPLHNREGVLLDTFLEDLFAWQHKSSRVRSHAELLDMLHRGEFHYLATSEERGVTPFVEPWVGFFHNPPNMPSWFHGDESPQSILARPVMQRSMAHCRGLFTLSEYHAEWLRSQTDLPVSALVHPTEIPEVQFAMDAFDENPEKKIVQVGWWLRQQSAIYQLPVWAGNPMGYRKVRLKPKFFENAYTYLDELLELEIQHLNIELDDRNLTVAEHVSDVEYDHLLQKNILFVSLFDASANNTVIESIARSTPILINRHPASIEYLGDDYPLFYDNLTDAAAKSLDRGRIEAAHRFLKEAPVREKLSPEYFRASFMESEVYSLLEVS